ncbi:hypothetical protein E5676_scaffold1607G00070 [Cucumis melo var. makuwa]|uniref:Uncharacterized protein n=1 Tax=Cucumis melo var. makuwa TaxID=1194695 RepID=A0A5D3DJG3_CUCMM|nr:hypothetical protein E6C27_scaffold98G001050 [Cucumis melo var. makuwa]TYK23702.1 hypothetical protein E5676_scaffold1607G00070 [Cucumis melo var. makuwa]
MGSAKLPSFIFSLLIALIILNLLSKFAAQNLHSPPPRPPANNKQFTGKPWESLLRPPSRPPGSDHQWPNQPVRTSPPPPF